MPRSAIPVLQNTSIPFFLENQYTRLQFTQPHVCKQGYYCCSNQLMPLGQVFLTCKHISTMLSISTAGIVQKQKKELKLHKPQSCIVYTPRLSFFVCCKSCFSFRSTTQHIQCHGVNMKTPPTIYEISSVLSLQCLEISRQFESLIRITILIQNVRSNKNHWNFSIMGRHDASLKESYISLTVSQYSQFFLNTANQIYCTFEEL